MNKLILMILIALLSVLPLTLMAQPENRWVQFYDAHELSDYLNDVFSANNNEYALAGHTRMDSLTGFWLVKTDEDGEKLWQHSYFDQQFPGISNWCYTVIQNDDGGFLLGGRCRDVNAERIFTVLRTDSDGDRIWWRGYGERGFYAECYAVIELKSGEFVAAGRNGGFQAYAVMMDANGDVIWENTYPGRWLRGIRETEGGLILIGSNNARDAWLFKIDFEGEIQWQQSYDSGQLMSLISCNDGGFAASGHSNYNWYFVRCEDNGDEMWTRSFNFDGNVWSTSLVQMWDDGYTLVGRSGDGTVTPAVVRTDRDGNEMWRRIDRNRDGRSGRDSYNSTILGHDGLVMVVGSAARDGRRVDGVLVKIIPEISPPTIVSFVPELREFSVLISDTILFAVEAFDLQDDTLTYTWTMNEDSIAIDTSTTIIFDELGDLSVKCVVSDGELADSVQWLGHVEEWYIDSYSPDSLAWTVRRPYEAEFSLGIRALEGIDPRYRWILTNREHQQIDVGNEADLNYTFDIQGEYSLEGRAFYEDTEHSVIWQVAVNSVLYWWRPHERQLDVEPREEIEFTVIPFNPDSDSLDYLWIVDGEDDGDVEDGIIVSFNDVGEHSVTAIVHDGAEVDTVIWTITVNPNTVDDDPTSLLPTEVTLYPAAPNPFNSTTTIRYFLPRSADVSLTVYDSAGRLVESLHDGMAMAGEQKATFQGTELPAGVYLLRLDSGEVIRSMKLVLLK